MGRTKVFISYSQKDTKWLERLHVHLAPLERNGLIERWDDTRIKVGAKWREEIKEELASAKVAIVLVSADLLASDFIVENELPPLLEAAEREGTVVMSVILSPSLFERTPLAQFQTVNPTNQPLIEMNWGAQERFFVKVAEAIQEPLEQASVVLSKSVQKKTTETTEEPRKIPALLKACQTQVKAVLVDIRHKYNPKLYVNRAIEHELKTFIDNPLENPVRNCFLIVAPAGSGKTNLLCDLARVRINGQPVLLLMGGNTYLSGTTGLLGTIQTELESSAADITLHSAGRSLHVIHDLAEKLNRDALIFLDAINEYEHPAQMRKAVQSILVKTREKRIKLVVSCRDFYWNLFKGRFWDKATFNKLPGDQEEPDEAKGDFSHFAPSEHEQALSLYLTHYKITGRPVGNAAEQCRHPLLLRFFCEAYREQDVGKVEDIRLKELFDRYWIQKLQSIAERRIHQGEELLLHGLTTEVGDYLLNIAAQMLHNNARAIPLKELFKATGIEENHSDPRTLYGRICDEFIILEEKEHGKGQHKSLQIAFVYEEFMEYVMARSLMADWTRAGHSDAKMLAEIEVLTRKHDSFSQIIGVIVYLALMLKEERDLALWSLLISQGEHWDKVVFEALRKLPKEQLDTGVLDALSEMLDTDKTAIQIQVLDVLKLKPIGNVAPASLTKRVCELTRHRQARIARRAVLALANMPAELVLPTLIEAGKHSQWFVRLNVVKALSKIGDLRAVGPLIAVLNDSNERVRQGAAKALGDLRDVRAVGPLIAALNDSDMGVRQGAVEVLGDLGDARAVEPLIAALDDSDMGVRWDAAKALGNLGQPAVEPLIAVLRDSDGLLRQDVLKALEALGRA